MVRSRWPWAVGATLAGALAGAGTAYAMRRLRPSDAPDALEPEQLEAVVDRPHPAPESPLPGSPVRHASAAGPA